MLYCILNYRETKYFIVLNYSTYNIYFFGKSIESFKLIFIEEKRTIYNYNLYLTIKHGGHKEKNNESQQLDGTGDTEVKSTCNLNDNQFLSGERWQSKPSSLQDMDSRIR